MSSQIVGSVGRWERGAQNAPSDVEIVQGLLEKAAQTLADPGIDPGGVDGKIAHPPASSGTVTAIEAFQRRFTSSVDGIIEPGSHSFDALLEANSEVPTVEEAPLPTQPSGSVGGFLFPFATIPSASWEESPRAFGSRRANGARLHAGCDLYFPKGTAIHAIGDGIVTRGPYAFYAETYAMEIDHGSFLARYGEIQSSTDVRVGDKVKAGQKIAKVGHLIGISVSSDMLHLELYDKSMSGPLTVGSGSGSAARHGVPFMRRKDLIDPTSKLNEWRTNLPSA